MSAVSLYYYLKLLKQVYVSEPAEGAGAIHSPVTTRIAVWLIATLVVLLGCLPDLLLNRIADALTTTFH